jgi:starch synthase
VFHQTDPLAIETAMQRAFGLWNIYPDKFRQLVAQGMRYDFSWNHPGQHYLSVYDYIRHK